MKAVLWIPVTATLLVAGGAVFADPAARAMYLANEAVLIARGDTKVLFDPLFEQSYGQYQLVPAEMEDKLFSGAPPFDGIDAVFVSHHHDDHFAPALMIAYLRAQQGVRLYAPAQAVQGMRRESGGDDALVFDRVTGLAIEPGDTPTILAIDGITIAAVRIPHSGWPDRMTDIENIAFRVTLDDEITVAHFGDADASIDHFRTHSAFWRERRTDLALPPYWFFLSEAGRGALNSEIRPEHAVGIHVPEEMPDDPAARPIEIRGFDLFTDPGETRDIP